MLKISGLIEVKTNKQKNRAVKDTFEQIVNAVREKC